MTRTFLGGRTPSIRNWVSGILTPAAAANTPGTAGVALPNGVGFIQLQSVAATFAGTFNSETVQAVVTVTFSDGQTTAWSISATTAGTLGTSATDIAALMRDGTRITRVSIALQSTIPSSAVTATARVVALQV